jgi:cellulose synthase/poly-beta-1,6-N-acetylglucosamine synthase-like glycosyltransferase
MRRAFTLLVLGFNVFVGIYYLAVNFVYTSLLAVAVVVVVRHMRRATYSAARDFSVSPETPPITVIIAAYNEQNTIRRTIESALSMDYPQYEIIVVNDGSDDATLDTLRAAYGLRKIDAVYRERLRTRPVRGRYHNPDIPNLIVVDKERGGKSDALNCGINLSRSPYFCSIDADTILERDALIRLATAVLESNKPVMAAGGVVRVINGVRLEGSSIADLDLPKSPLAMLQIVEYLRAFFFGRVGWDSLNALLILSGTFSLFNKAAAIEVGGFNLGTVTEDMEIIVRMQRHYRLLRKPFTIRFISDPICWTEVPESLGMLGRQRRRWHLGLIQSLLRHRVMLFNPRYGLLGLVAMPFYFFVEMLGPAVEVAGYGIVLASYLLGMLSFEFLLLFLTLAIFYGVLLSVLSIFLEEVTYRRYPKWSHLGRLFLYAAIENFGYRQLNSLWRVQAMIFYWKGKRQWEYVQKGGAPSPRRK